MSLRRLVQERILKRAWSSYEKMNRDTRKCPYDQFSSVKKRDFGTGKKILSVNILTEVGEIVLGMSHQLVLKRLSVRVGVCGVVRVASNKVHDGENKEQWLGSTYTDLR